MKASDGWRRAVLLTVIVLFAAVLFFPDAVLGSGWFGLRQATTSVCPDPSYAEIDVGEEITVSLMIYDVVDLFSMQMIMRFDPAMIQVQDSDSGTPGVQVGVGAVLTKTQTTLDGWLDQTVDNGTGTITVLTSYAQPDLSYTGSGAMLEIRVMGAGGGTTGFTFDQLILSDSGGASIDYDICASSIVVLDGTYTPEPTNTPTNTATPTATPTSTPDAVRVYLNPPHRDVALDASAEVDVVVEDVESLYGAAFKVGFDPTLLQVLDADGVAPGVQVGLGPFLAGPYGVGVNDVNNLTGVIDVGFTQQSPTEPVTGTGVIATITFTGTSDGLSVLDLYDVILSNPDAIEIPSYDDDGEIQVHGDSPITPTIVGSLSFEARSAPPALDWVTPITVSLVKWDGTMWFYGATTDATGVFTVEVEPTGTLNVRARDLHSLWNVRRNVDIQPGLNFVDLRTGPSGDSPLVEGDANLDRVIDVLDFSILASTFAASLGDPGFDPRADFNNSQEIDVLDFSILASNYLQGDRVILNP